MVIKSSFEEWVGTSNKIDLQKEWHYLRSIDRNKNNQRLET